MKGQGKLRKNNKRKKDIGNLQKYKVSVNEFVQSKGGCGEAEDDHGLRCVKKKSRKELRKEKRKMKKAKMKSHKDQTNLNVRPGGGEDSGPPAGNIKQIQKKKKKVKEKPEKEDSKTPLSKATSKPTEKSEHAKTQPTTSKGKKTNKLQESRKKALLEANEEEDREIKRLERYLGINKRKNKKSLPQSFAIDGLDYILGVLDSGSSAVGMMYDSDEDMDMAKEKFEKLDESHSEMSGEEEEPGDESANESGDKDLDAEVEENEVDMEDEDDDDGGVIDEEEAEEEEEDGQVESDVADSDSESEGEEEEEMDGPSTKTSGPKTVTVSSEI